jgi:hypothetical protein
MIIARLKWDTPLYKVDQFVTKFMKKNKYKQFEFDLKITDSECCILIFKKLN